MNDIIDDALAELKSKTLERVKSLMDSVTDTNRVEFAMELGAIIIEGKRAIEAQNVKDPRIQKALDELEDVFVKIVRGEDPFKS